MIIYHHHDLPALAAKGFQKTAQEVEVDQKEKNRKYQKIFKEWVLPVSITQGNKNRRRFWHAAHGCVAPYIDIIRGK